MKLTLAEQLAAAGLVRTQEAVAADQQFDNQLHGVIAHQRGTLNSKHHQSASLMTLKQSQTVGEFREQARQLLLVDTSVLPTIIREAHKLRDKDGAKKLVAMLYGIRDRLGLIDPNSVSRRKEIINKALRRANPKLDPLTDF